MTEARWHHDRQVVLDWCADLTRLPEHAAGDVEVFLPAPFDHIGGATGDVPSTADQAEEVLFGPLRRAFGHSRLTPVAVVTEVGDDSTDVAVMGMVGGPRSAPFVGVPAGDGPGLRVAMIVRLVDGAVTRLHLLTDLPDLAHQAGIELLPAATGRTIPHPAPPPSLGRPDRPDPAGAERTRRLVTALIGGLNQLTDGELASMPQRDLWADDMRWIGPHGIGVCEGFAEYQTAAQQPSVLSFPDRRGVWPKPAFVVDGHLAAFVGWPGLVGTFSGPPFRGIPSTGGPISQRIIDVYLRRGDQLLDDWVFIDLVDFARQCGVDLLAPLG